MSGWNTNNNYFSPQDGAYGVYKFHCVITDFHGNTETSEEIIVTYKKEYFLETVHQPSNIIKNGILATAEVRNSANDEFAEYQWLFSESQTSPDWQPMGEEKSHLLKIWGADRYSDHPNSGFYQCVSVSSENDTARSDVFEIFVLSPPEVDTILKQTVDGPIYVYWEADMRVGQVEVYRSEDGEHYTPLGWAESGNNYFEDNNNLVPERTYYYKLVGRSGNLDSDLDRAHPAHFQY